MQPVVIIGAGAHARETLDVVDAINAQAPTYDVLGYVVERDFGTPGALVNERPILGDFDWFAGHVPTVQAICAVGAPELRRRLALRAADAGVRFCSVVHPSVLLTRRVTWGCGVVLCAGCVLTTQVQIADHVHINIGCTVSHDSVLEDFATLAPGVHAAGGVVFREGCNVGVGSTIAPRRAIGAWSVVGTGAVVIDDVPDNSTVVGVPATVRNMREPGWHLLSAGRS